MLHDALHVKKEGPRKRQRKLLLLFKPTPWLTSADILWQKLTDQ